MHDFSYLKENYRIEVKSVGLESVEAINGRDAQQANESDLSGGGIGCQREG